MLRTAPSALLLLLLLCALAQGASPVGNLPKGSRVPVAHLCETLLEEFGALGDVKIRREGTLWLVVEAEDAYRRGEIHEVESSQHYARFIASRGEHLLYVPELANRSMPAFDGVVIGADGKPLANYSLKTVIDGGRATVDISRLESAITQARRFSAPAHWLEYFTLILHEVPFGDAVTVVPRFWRDSEEFTPRRRTLRQAMDIFGIHAESRLNPRPLRLVVDIGGHSVTPTLQDIVYFIRDHAEILESVTFLRTHWATVVTAKGYERHPIPQQR